jgi:hypothetical protein
MMTLMDVVMSASAGADDWLGWCWEVCGRLGARTVSAACERDDDRSKANSGRSAAGVPPSTGACGALGAREPGQPGEKEGRGDEEVQPQAEEVVGGVGAQQLFQDPKSGGRRPKLNPEQIALAQQLHDAGERTVQQIPDIFNVPRTTVYGHLDQSRKGKRRAVPRAVAGA